MSEPPALAGGNCCILGPPANAGGSDKKPTAKPLVTRPLRRREFFLQPLIVR